MLLLQVIILGDQKEIMNYIDKENRLLRPKNLYEPVPGKGFYMKLNFSRRSNLISTFS